MRILNLVFAASFLIIPWFADGEELHAGPLDVSLSVAGVIPGVIFASFEKDFPPELTAAFSNTVSPGFKLVADYYPPAIPWLAPSIASHYVPLFLPEDIDLGYWDGRDHIIPKNDIHFVEIEGGIKYRSFLGKSWTAEPGLYFGYCHTFSSSPDAVNNGFIIDVNTEIQRHYRNFHVLFTLGFMTQRYGGVKDIAYIRSLPVIYLSAGVGL
ncbi:MAG: hypothetical protein JW852_02350 [Spirochaetales bacterium]|nr:hypothetical protein [Spirochaetales bacterium]